MKNKLFAMLAAFTAAFNLLGAAFGLEKTPGQTKMTDPNEITPLYLDDAASSVKNSEFGSMLCAHYSHSSHVSHASHFSHYSSRIG